MIAGSAEGPVSPRKALLLKVGIAVFFLSFCVGCVAIHLLLDLEEESPVSRSLPGLYLRRLLRINPMFAGLFLNGGLIGMLICTSNLFERKKPESKAMVKDKKQQ